VILREGPQTLGRGLPQLPSKGFLHVFGRHLGASEIQKVSHFFLLPLSSLKDYRMDRRCHDKERLAALFIGKEADRSMLPLSRHPSTSPPSTLASVNWNPDLK